MKDVITTMIENNNYLSKGGCQVVIKEMYGEEIQPLELTSLIPVPSE